jgi:hypothetical protein
MTALAALLAVAACMPAPVLPAEPAAQPFEISAEIHVAPDSDGSYRTVVAAPVELNMLQVPWLLRLDPDGTLTAGVNAQRTDITLCRSAFRVPVAHDTRVGFSHDGVELVLFVAGDEVARCAAPGRVPSHTPRMTVGFVRNEPNPGAAGPDHQRFVGEVSRVRTALHW